MFSAVINDKGIKNIIRKSRLLLGCKSQTTLKIFKTGTWSGGNNATHLCVTDNLWSTVSATVSWTPSTFIAYIKQTANILIKHLFPSVASL